MAPTNVEEREPDLLRSVMEEIQELQRNGNLITRTRPALPPSAPEAAPKRRRSRRSPVVPVTVAFGLILVLAAGYLTYSIITSSIRLQSARTALERGEDEIEILGTQLNNAHQFRGEKHFRRARDAYNRVKTGAESLLARVRYHTRQVRDSETRARADDLAAQAEKLRDEASRWLDTDDIKYRGQGLVFFEGEWMTPEEKQRRYEERMKALGKTFYEGEWRTPEEIAALRGEVYYKGRYVSKAEYERILEEERRKASLPPPPAPKTTPGEPAPRPPRPPRQQFDPADARWVLDDFEQGHDWRSVTWPNANPCQLAVLEGPESKRLRVTIPEGAQDKCAIVRQFRADLSSRSAIVFDAENRTDSYIPVAVALITDEYYESRPVMLRPGVSKGITFQLGSGDFKCKATSWTHAAQITRPDSCMWLHILFYHNERGVVILDNIVAVGD